MTSGEQVFSEELRLQELFEEMSTGTLGLMWVDTGSQWSSSSSAATAVG